MSRSALLSFPRRSPLGAVPWITLLALGLPLGCKSYEPMPLPKGLLDLEGMVEERGEKRGYLGLEVAPNESDSLDDLEVLPGVRVRVVVPGSPAEEIGIRPGHVLLKFEQTPVNDPDRLESLLLGMAEDRTVALELQRGSEVYTVDVPIPVRSPFGARRPLYHIERGLVRAAFRNSAEEGAFPEVALLTDDSPLRSAGVKEGDLVLAFQGQDPGSAAELVRRFGSELEPGETGTLTVRQRNGKEKTLDFQAWEPERELTSMHVGPLYKWDYDRAEDRESQVILDLFLISLFECNRVGKVKEFCILGLITWETGEPELEAVQLPGGGADANLKEEDH